MGAPGKIKNTNQETRVIENRDQLQYCRGRTLHDAFCPPWRGAEIDQWAKLNVSWLVYGANFACDHHWRSTHSRFSLFVQNLVLSEALKIPKRSQRNRGGQSESGKDVIRHKLVKAIIEAYENDMLPKIRKEIESFQVEKIADQSALRCCFWNPEKKFCNRAKNVDACQEYDEVWEETFYSLSCSHRWDSSRDCSMETHIQWKVKLERVCSLEGARGKGVGQAL